MLAAKAQSAHPEVLVVYNAAQADSLAVAQHYMARRQIPAANLCAVSPPATDTVSLSDYATYVKAPIQNCLRAAGPNNILYIVMAYLMPFAISTNPGTWALDSYVADIWDAYLSQPFLITPPTPQPYYADSQSQGNAYVPFQPFAAFRSSPQSALIYSVWRLDGPSAGIASALVDQAIQAEASGGPAGQACIDREDGDLSQLPDGDYISGDWDLHQAAAFLRQAGIQVLEDANGAEFGTPPAPLVCPNTAFYAGWYSYNDYNDAFQWQTGSIGWHLDSASALNPRSGPSWVANALQRGIAVTSGSVDEPYLQALVRPGGAYRNLLEGASVGDAFLRNTLWLKWRVLYVGDPLYRPFAAGRPPFRPLQPVDSLQLSPQELVGGKSSIATVTLRTAAPAGGLTFNIASDPGATAPPSVIVAAGSSTAQFPLSTSLVSESHTPILTLSSPGLILRNTLTVDPLLQALVPSATTAGAGLPVTVTAVLNDLAPPGGAVLTLASDNSAIASVPATVEVPAGSTTGTFSVSTAQVTSAGSAKISASYAGAQVSTTLSIVPALTALNVLPASISAGGSLSIAVYLATPAPASGATVQLSSSDPMFAPVPATVSVPAGAVYGATYATVSGGAPSETLTVTATYGGATANTRVTILGGASSGTASFVKADPVTAGDWKAGYGADGFNVLGDTAGYPGYAAVTAAGQQFWTWTSSTTDTRALQKTSAADRVAATWYAGGTFTIDLNLMDGNTHQVALYCVDWDFLGRAQTINVLDGAGKVLDSRTISGFTNGTYLVWNLSGHVTFQLVAAGRNAVVSGIFFGAAPASTGGAKASFVQMDWNSMGNWKGPYGAWGFNVLGDAASDPGFATVTPAGQQFWTWASSSGDLRALQKLAGSDRVAATWYSPGAFTIDVNIIDGKTHEVALYCVDWDSLGRAQTISVLNSGGTVLDSRQISGFTTGVYLVWKITGHVSFQVTRSGGQNAVVSGIFFDN